MFGVFLICGVVCDEGVFEEVIDDFGVEWWIYLVFGIDWLYVVYYVEC